jgi:signal transduction histidine kinase
VSRLLRGRVELRPERIDLGRIARTALDDQRDALKQAGLSLEADLPELPVWVNADPTRLTQVLDNLIQNAVKFTERGGTVSVGVRAEAGRNQAVLTVRDTGLGIEPGLLPHLFETFTRPRPGTVPGQGPRGTARRGGSRLQ